MNSLTTGADFVLKRLDELAKEKEKSFDLDSWESIFNQLRESNLTSEQAQKVIDSLMAIAAPDAKGNPTSSTFPALVALSAAINGIFEVRDQLRIIQPGDAKGPALLKALGLNTYLLSGDLVQELEILKEGESGGVDSGSNINPRLALLFDLIKNSNAFTLDELEVGSETRTLLRIFFENRNKELAARGEGKIVVEALNGINANGILQAHLDHAQEKLKRKNYAEFVEKFQDLQRLMDEHLERHKVRLVAQGEGKVAHQLNVLGALLDVRNVFARSIEFFAEKELNEGTNFISQFVPIHRQMIQVAENSVALIFIGLIKTGKSTVVDTVIGETVSPSRVEPMTAIPVRYIHDPSAKEPVMLVPFFLKLNKVIRLIVKAIHEKGIDAIKEKIATNHLRSLLDKIASGYIFRNVYKGAEEVLEASIALHDLFRLAVQEVFKNLGDELPLDWGQGLDGFLTVTIKFPATTVNVGDEVKLSVVDTPGVNEAGVKKLNLHKVIADSVEVSHYVAFTIDPKSSDAKDNTNLKKLLKDLRKQSRTPNLVLVTGRDTRSELPREVENTRENIAASLRDQNVNYPIDSVFVIAAKRKLFAERMISFLDRYNRKPEPNDPTKVGAKLAEDFIFFAVEGLAEEEKRANYNKLTVQDLRQIADKLVINSFMHEPMDRMLITAATSAAILSSNKAIEKTLASIKPISDYLRKAHENKETELKEKETLLDTCREVSKKIADSVLPIKTDLSRGLTKFKRELKGAIQDKSKDLIAKYSDDLDNATLEYGSRQEAEEAIDKWKADAQQDFEYDADDILSDKIEEFKSTSFEDLRAKVKKQIFEQLQRIANEINSESENFEPKVPENISKMDTKSLAFKSKVVSGQVRAATLNAIISVGDIEGTLSSVDPDTFELKREPLKKEVQAHLQQLSTSTIQLAGTQLERAYVKALDDLFLQALRRVSLIAEQLSNRDRLLPEAKAIEELFQGFAAAETNLKLLLKDLK